MYILKIPLVYLTIEVIIKMSVRSHFTTGKGNGKPLQYSCLENPMNNSC